MPKIKVQSSARFLHREERIAQAIQALETGKCCSLSEAATAFDIPKSTLGHRMNGRQSRQKGHEGDQILSPAAKKAIVRWISKLEQHGFPTRLDRVWQMAKSLAVKERMALKERYEREGRKNAVHDTLGKNWITQFLDRHPELAAKLAVRMDKQRVYANDYTTIKDYTKKLGKVLAEHDIKDHNISNVYEKSITLGYSAKIQIITQCSRKNPYVKQDGKREMVTLVEAVSANGFLFPTFLFTKGKVHTYGQFGNVKEDDKDVRFGKSPKGWKDEELGYYWLTDTYYPCSLENAQ